MREREGGEREGGREGREREGGRDGGWGEGGRQRSERGKEGGREGREREREGRGYHSTYLAVSREPL